MCDNLDLQTIASGDYRNRSDWIKIATEKLAYPSHRLVENKKKRNGKRSRRYKMIWYIIWDLRFLKARPINFATVLYNTRIIMVSLYPIHTSKLLYPSGQSMDKKKSILLCTKRPSASSTHRNADSPPSPFSFYKCKNKKVLRMLFFNFFSHQIYQ